MKNTLLIAHRWKTLGWILVIPALVTAIYMLSNSMTITDYLPVTIPNWLAKFMWIDINFMSSDNDKPIVIGLLDELITFSLLIGLLILGFSKEKIEDEWVQKVRLESLQWAILVNTALILIVTLLVHGFPFLSVMIYNMFTTLLIFVGRFYWILRIKPMFSKS